MHLVRATSLKRIHESLYAEIWDIHKTHMEIILIGEQMKVKTSGTIGCWMTLEDRTSNIIPPIATVDFSFVFDRSETLEWEAHRAAIFAALMESRLEPPAPDANVPGVMIDGREQNIYACHIAGEKIGFQNAELAL